MSTCTIETGLLRKKPCGHVAVANCLNCDQPLCVEHTVAQLSDAGKRTGKFMCHECDAAAKEHAKSMAAVARAQEAKKLAALDKAAREQAAAPAAPKKPAASTPSTPSTPHALAQPAPAEQPKEPDALEFTPKDGKLDYTRKEDEPGHKPD
jgi:hypothetical protein